MISKALRAGSHYVVRYYTKLEKTSLSVICVRRKGKMSLGRPAAGGESAKGRILIQSIPLVSFTEGHVFDMIQGKFINKFRKIHKKTEDIPLNARIKSTKLIIWTKGDKGWTG